jgi:hypothetical protein
VTNALTPCGPAPRAVHPISLRRVGRAIWKVSAAKASVLRVSPAVEFRTVIGDSMSITFAPALAARVFEKLDASISTPRTVSA